MTRRLTYREYYRMRPDEFESGDQIAVKLVLVLGYSGDYAVYVGEEDDDADEVARHGDKVPPGVAETMFLSAVMGRCPRL